MKQSNPTQSDSHKRNAAIHVVVMLINCTDIPSLAFVSVSPVPPYSAIRLLVSPWPSWIKNKLYLISYKQWKIAEGLMFKTRALENPDGGGKR